MSSITIDRVIDRSNRDPFVKADFDVLRFGVVNALHFLNAATCLRVQSVGD